MGQKGWRGEREGCLFLVQLLCLINSTSFSAQMSAFGSPISCHKCYLFEQTEVYLRCWKDFLCSLPCLQHYSQLISAVPIIDLPAIFQRKVGTLSEKFVALHWAFFSSVYSILFLYPATAPINQNSSLLSETKNNWKHHVCFFQHK